ncbi:hypothetical protein MAPG_09778 [Magnaporthiopsis poae ATCC 64411]|uniref:Uncharacterized protein n=1 Tax=Magnaporthiopsis poae (strain ATCC 64411 / 73-15) TaxID=644358 RepID=A0A0C4EAU7_MAGP6|nr:hypothetical protein MAPG_09778 [Magnaporthiopsis poae ATCC 64411]
MGRPSYTHCVFAKHRAHTAHKSSIARIHPDNLSALWTPFQNLLRARGLCRGKRKGKVNPDGCLSALFSGAQKGMDPLQCRLVSPCLVAWSTNLLPWLFGEVRLCGGQFEGLSSIQSSARGSVLQL